MNQERSREALLAEAEQTWANSPEVREEFVNHKAAFLAYHVANSTGQIRRIGDRDQARNTNKR